MKKVLILMSTYNGSDYIRKQVETILKQKNVETNILIRDDGSNKETIELLKELKKEYADRIDIILGKNIGWKKSFINLLNNANLKYDYYGFSDQDDIWMENKCYNCILKMESDTNTNLIKLCHCNNCSVDENFVPRKEQEYRIDKPKSHKNAFATEYFQGCGMLWNAKAMELIKNTTVNNEDVAHDFWVGLICYLFGEIYFVEEPQFYHIRYTHSESSDGSKNKGRIKRLKNILTNKSMYMNPAKDLLNNFRKELTETDIIFLEKLSLYKKHKLELILDKEFCRNSLLSTIFMKGVIIINKY